MLDENEALDIAKKYVKSIEERLKLKNPDKKQELVILESETIPKSYGWIFFYSSKKLLETNDFLKYGLVGNGPFLINKFTGEIKQMGSAKGYEYYSDLYEKQGYW